MLQRRTWDATYQAPWINLFWKEKKRKKSWQKNSVVHVWWGLKLRLWLKLKHSTYEFIQFQGTGSYTEKRLLNMYIYIHIYKQFYKSRKANISDQNNSIIWKITINIKKLQHCVLAFSICCSFEYKLTNLSIQQWCNIQSSRLQNSSRLQQILKRR